MKHLCLYLLLLLGAAVGCAQQQQVTSGHQILPVSFLWRADTIASTKVGGKVYADLSYSGSNPKYCHLGFRVYLLREGEPVPAGTSPDTYLGSYAVGMDCSGTFRIPVPARFLGIKGKLALTVVPLDQNDNVLSADLRPNFRFRLRTGP